MSCRIILRRRSWSESTPIMSPIGANHFLCSWGCVTKWRHNFGEWMYSLWFYTRFKRVWVTVSIFLLTVLDGIRSNMKFDFLKTTYFQTTFNHATSSIFSADEIVNRSKQAESFNIYFSGWTISIKSDWIRWIVERILVQFSMFEC